MYDIIEAFIFTLVCVWTLELNDRLEDDLLYLSSIWFIISQKYTQLQTLYIYELNWLSQYFFVARIDTIYCR